VRSPCAHCARLGGYREVAVHTEDGSGQELVYVTACPCDCPRGQDLAEHHAHATEKGKDGERASRPRPMLAREFCDHVRGQAHDAGRDHLVAVYLDPSADQRRTAAERDAIAARRALTGYDPDAEARRIVRDVQAARVGAATTRPGYDDGEVPA